MREKGCSREELFSFLARRRGEDLEYGRILSSMCTRPHPVAVEAEAMFAGTNLGDPGLFPGTAGIERLLIESLGDLLHHPGACGYATSGGTESNIQVLRMARGLTGVKDPNVVVPESAHFSFEKACDLLSIEIRSVRLDRDLRMDAAAAAEQACQQSVAVLGRAVMAAGGNVAAHHLADRLGVLEGPRGASAQDGNLGHPLHEGLHFPAELLAQSGLAGLGVFQHVVQERRDDPLRVHVDVHEDGGHAQRVDEKRVPGRALLLPVQPAGPIGRRKDLLALFGTVDGELLPEVGEKLRDLGRGDGRRALPPLRGGSLHAAPGFTHAGLPRSPRGDDRSARGGRAGRRSPGLCPPGPSPRRCCGSPPGP